MRSKEARAEYERQIELLQRFIEDPWSRQNATVQVMVPKVFRSPASGSAPPQHPPAALGGDNKSEEEAALAAASARRVSLQKRAAAMSVAAEDYARKFEPGDLLASAKDNAGEEENQSNAKVMCRLCFSGENEGTEKARKMLPCNSCGMKYHGSCLKTWSHNRALFHWSLWTCPSCRICEVCHQTGDPNKFMFCKRCDDAYHCYCLQPSHKNVSHGPYLCPKHTRCHSCLSTVPGNGISVRWFLGYTCCDACGRLFLKGNYCPVCLKVYRDSESTPMVCCDICQRWVHCPCDGISDEKYMQFQVDGSLQYVCPICRGECRQVKNLEEAVEELWRMRDEADKHEIATLRGAAGLPTHEEIFQISPFSDDDEIEPPKIEYSRSLKLPLKGFSEKSTKKSKEYGKKESNRKYGKKNSPLFGSSTANKNEEIQFYGELNSLSSPAAKSLTEGTSSINQAWPPLKHKFINEIPAISGDGASTTIKINSAKHCGSSKREDVGNNASMSKPFKGPKLVIHLGGHGRNITSPPRSEASSFRKGQDLTSSEVDIEDMAHLKVHEYFDNAEIKCGDQRECKIDNADQVKESVSPLNTRSSLGKRSIEDVPSDFPTRRRNRYNKLKYGEDGPSVLGDLMDDKNTIPSISETLPKYQESHLKFKIPKKSNNGNQDTQSLPWKDNMTFVKGQRSKRRRPAKFEERASVERADNTLQQYEDDTIEGADNTQQQYEDDTIEGADNTPQQYEDDTIEGADNTPQQYENDTMNAIMDASWILQKLGKDAAGKRVEVQQPSNNSWRRGTVVEVVEGTSIVSIALDEGRVEEFEFGKQEICFVPPKQKL